MGKCITAFCDLVRQHQKPGMSVVEIGCWVGDTTIGYLETVAKNSGKVAVVDTFCGNPTASGEHEYNPTAADEVYEEFCSNIKKSGFFDIVTIWKMDSIVASRMFDDCSIDICFIDADHRYEHVLGDIKSYLPKIKLGGVLSGHDLENFDRIGKFSKKELEVDYVQSLDGNYYHPGVCQAVYDIFGTNVKLILDRDHSDVNIWISNID